MPSLSLEDSTRGTCSRGHSGFVDPLAREDFDRLLAILGDLCGPAMLRAKGIIVVHGEPLPLVVHAVQDVLHPPEPLQGVHPIA